MYHALASAMVEQRPPKQYTDLKDFELALGPHHLEMRREGGSSYTPMEACAVCDAMLWFYAMYHGIGSWHRRLDPIP